MKDRHEVLRWTVKSVSLVCTVLFEGLRNAKDQAGKHIFEEVQAVICSLLHNRCHIVVLSNSGHDQPSLQNIKHFVQFNFVMMYVINHRRRLFFLLQLQTFYGLFVVEVEDCVGKEYVMENEKVCSQRKTVIKVEANTLTMYELRKCTRLTCD